jgi:hypothetical protein
MWTQVTGTKEFATNMNFFNLLFGSLDFFVNFEP